MTPTYIVIGIAVVVAIAGTAAFSTPRPDFDAIISNKDCDTAGNLTSAD